MRLTTHTVAFGRARAKRDRPQSVVPGVSASPDGDFRAMAGLRRFVANRWQKCLPVVGPNAMRPTRRIPSCAGGANFS